MDEVLTYMVATPRRFWLLRPTVVLYRLGLRRLARWITCRFVRVDIYDDGEYLGSIALLPPRR